MCLVVWNWEPDTASPFILLSNRDEFYSRPTESLHWWDDNVLAGRDLQDGGTWLGVNRRGKLAVLTNYRTTQERKTNAPSRGGIVTDFLSSNESLGNYLQQLSSVAHTYNPFNLLIYDGTHLKGFESHTEKVIDIQPGIGGLSNAQFDTPWPKLRNLKNRFKKSLQSDRADEIHLLDLLRNDSVAPDEELPSTGLSLERERELSACFIKTSDYGTRTSSLIEFKNRQVKFVEQGYNTLGPTELIKFSFQF